MNGRSERIRNKLRQHARKDIHVCSIVKAELFYGSMHSSHPEHNLFRQKQFLSRFESLPFDDAAAGIYGQIRASLTARGMLIGPYDMMIAAIAIANSLILVTHNQDEFKRVENLRLEDWEIQDDIHIAGFRTERRNQGMLKTCKRQLPVAD